jgi:hypothetical protein
MMPTHRALLAGTASSPASSTTTVTTQTKRTSRPITSSAALPPCTDYLSFVTGNVHTCHAVLLFVLTVNAYNTLELEYNHSLSVWLKSVHPCISTCGILCPGHGRKWEIRSRAQDSRCQHVYVGKVAAQDIGLSEWENTHGVVIIEIFWSGGSTIRVIQRIRLYEP